MREYKVVTAEQAYDLGCYPDFSEQYDDYRNVLMEVNHDNGNRSYVGEDGGEPEDQTLGRDWRWVAAAMNAAYKKGCEDTMALYDKGELP